MNTTSTDFAHTFPRDVALGLFDAIDKGTKVFYGWVLSAVKQLLVQHWAILLGILILVLIFAFVEYIVTGRWRTLGRVLYSYIYWGIVLVVALIFGSDIFASDWIKVLLFFVYLFSFWLVGRLLTKIGIYHH